MILELLRADFSNGREKDVGGGKKQQGISYRVHMWLVSKQYDIFPHETPTVYVLFCLLKESSHF